VVRTIARDLVDAVTALGEAGIPSDSFSAARMLRDFNRSSDMPGFGEFLDRLETAQGAAAIRALRDHAFLRPAADAEVDVSDVLTRAQQTSAAAPPRPKRPRKPLSYISGPPADEDGEGSAED